MKTHRTDEILVKAGVRLPQQMMEVIKNMAVKERRSLNDQVIVLLEKGIEVYRANNPA